MKYETDAFNAERFGRIKTTNPLTFGDEEIHHIQELDKFVNRYAAEGEMTSDVG